MGSNYGLGWVGSGCVEIFSFWWVGPAIAKVLNICKDYVNALKNGQIRFGCTKQLNLLVVVGWVGLGPNFFHVLGWVSQMMGWVGSGHTKWTHGQLWVKGKAKARVFVTHRGILEDPVRTDKANFAENRYSKQSVQARRSKSSGLEYPKRS